MRQLRSALAFATSETAAEVRPLGAFENILAAYNEEAVTTFTMMAELEGDITKTGIERALAAVQARHPLLSVGIRHGETGRRVFVRTHNPIPLKELPSGAVPWQLAGGLELRRRFDVEEGPLMIASVRFEPKTVRMFFTFQHSIADGLSAVFVIRDFVRAMNGERLERFGATDALDERLARLPRPDPIGPEETGSAGMPAVPDVETVRRWGRGMSAMPVVSSLAFKPEFTRRLRVVARFHDTTVHAALAVAMVRSLGELNGSPQPIRLKSPINQRKLLGIAEACGLYVSAGITPLKVAGPSFWDDARKARASLEAFMTSDAVHNMIGGMNAFRDGDDSAAGARAAFAGGMDFDAVLNNLGVLPIKARHGRYRIKSLAGPIQLASVEDEHNIGMVTLEDQLQLTYTSTLPLPGLLPRIERSLMEACAGW